MVGFVLLVVVRMSELHVLRSSVVVVPMAKGQRESRLEMRN